MTSRRGFTLVELLVSLVLLVIVLGATYQLLTNTQRISRAQAERVDMQSNMRAGTIIIPTELQALGYDTIPVSALGNTISPDIIAAAPDSIVFRAMRGAGIICAISVSGSQATFTVSTDWLYSAARAPVASPRDSALIFVDDNPDFTTDDRWIARPITSVGASSASACPAGWPNGRTGYSITVTASGTFTLGGTSVTDNLTASQFTVGSPIRFFEVMQYGLYTSGGKQYLGAYSLSNGDSREPVLGPLASSGFQLAYFDSAGTALSGTSVAVRSRIRAVRVTLVGASDQNVSSTGYGGPAQVTDSVVTTVALRNSVTR
jgi:prepilin-type N-terminal cleavage/methylation domain-containing protein